MTINTVEIKNVMASADQLYTAAEISEALATMASAINDKVAALGQLELPPLVLSVMNGALIFAGQLLPRLNFPVQIDYIHATRYRNTTQGHDLQWKVYPQHELKNRVVIILDDILDEGYTLDAIADYCRQQQAADVLTAVLVTKIHDRCKPGVASDFSALDVEDRYVFGYGMDYKGQLRNANGIYAIRES